MLRGVADLGDCMYSYKAVLGILFLISPVILNIRPREQWLDYKCRRLCR